jgi:hypothetical protein
MGENLHKFRSLSVIREVFSAKFGYVQSTPLTVISYSAKVFREMFASYRSAKVFSLECFLLSNSYLSCYNILIGRNADYVLAGANIRMCYHHIKSLHTSEAIHSRLVLLSA